MTFFLKCIFVFFSLYIGGIHAETHHPQEFLQSIKGSKSEGKEIVKHFCATCHSAKPLIQLGAPRINNLNDWSPRVHQGLASLLAHTEEGYNAMPARGGCFECSDEQLRFAVEAMIPKKLRSRF